MNRTDLVRLWNELADLPAAQFDEALAQLMSTLCGWLRAELPTH